MLDDYSLRLLAEIGIDVYVPRAVASAIANGPAAQAVPSSDRSPATGAASQTPRVDAAPPARFLIVCAQEQESRLLSELLRGLRMAGLEAAIAEAGQTQRISEARGLLILGESLMRSLGADMSAQRQNEIAWVVSSEPAKLAQSATAKRALWGEIKRLSRSQHQRPRGIQVD